MIQPSPKEDLLRHDAYPAACVSSSAPPIILRETHISWVFLLESDVFKLKKPVDLGFLDFRTIDQRKAACEAELRLNARLAPDVYLDVVPVRVGHDGRATIAGTGPIVDWAVHMKRLPDEARADQLLARHALEPAAIESIARRIAAFHASAPADPGLAAFGNPAAIAANVEENFAQTTGTLGEYLRPKDAEEVVRWQTAFVRDRPELFERRIATGHVRDGHGDLRLEHVYFGEDDEVTVLDCIEFNERFRFADVCADIAFLSMDLAGHGRVDLAERLLAAYAREADDFDLYSVVDFYEGYRAFVRGKIAAMVARDESIEQRARDAASAEARRYFVLSLAMHRRPLLLPAVVAVGGIIGSGKSTVAECVGAEMGAPVVDADRTRKQMLGVETTRRLNDPAWSGAYDPAFTETVYAEVLRRAGVVLQSGRPVVLDASFRSADMRRAARELAVRHDVPFRLIECSAPADVCKARIVERARHRPVSDGRIAIFDDFVARFEAITELATSEHVVLDTTRPLERNMETLRAILDTWPRGLNA